MHLSSRSRPFVCLPCQIRAGRPCIAAEYLWAASRPRRNFTSISRIREQRTERADDQPVSLRFSPEHSTTIFASTAQHHQASEEPVEDSGVEESHNTQNIPLRRIKGRGSASFLVHRPKQHSARNGLRHFATSKPSAIELSESQQEELKIAHSLRQRLTQGLSRVPEIKNDPSVIDGIPIDDILKALPADGHSPIQKKLIDRLGTEFAGQTFGNVRHDLDLVASHRTPSQRTVEDPRTKDALIRFGIIPENDDTTTQNDENSDLKLYRPIGRNKTNAVNDSPKEGKGRGRQSLASMVMPPQPAVKPKPLKAAKIGVKVPTFPMKSAKTEVRSVAAGDLVTGSLETEGRGELPRLSHDLSRVLFNQGVYQLQDPRSRVFNFDPYLEQLMPISEFNFEALNPYRTSSEDKRLHELARTAGKRYIGSSSSMTTALSQFHFLISQWRELNVENFTRGFQETLRSFTALSRQPAAIFLRYRDGVYAVDADKEYDEPNVLMSLGKYMEKLLTREKDDFEKWRKKSRAENGQVLDQPEVFHYSEQGRFLLRSQLDAYDPRLPGKGYFDLKTRAVAGIRMNMREHEAGMGYQIKERFGTWESYEREYYDMMRSTFLKYSLQARMGSMDGIFVAYHNISRMFGFQYVSMSEMDLALHGQSDPCLGDQEFRFSINFMEEIFNQATEIYPNQSLRIHFEAREASVSTPKPYMNIFIEPMSEDDIKAIQNSQKAQHEVFERRLLRGEDPAQAIDEENLEIEASEDKAAEDNASSSGPDREGVEVREDPPLPINTPLSGTTGPATSAANKDFLDNIMNTKAPYTKPQLDDRKVAAFKLVIQNKINDRLVARPELITPAARWTIDYQVERWSDEEAVKLYRYCKNRRMASIKSVINRGSDDYFTRSIRQMSEKGAQWRREQDHFDAQRERVVLYGDHQPPSEV